MFLTVVVSSNFFRSFIVFFCLFRLFREEHSTYQPVVLFKHGVDSDRRSHGNGKQRQNGQIHEIQSGNVEF
ncbi:hypothetical protein Phum_PHUM017940 [Pediculus humanus corporis]|uniref:Uncharacterized protein n=1 Tax=Pediculus humanus subsp. corporis TaxID=121224 RepID=E0V9Q1_PEDHC|nr:uncharacterized protein Phum_PHUM017940 [Pediculus humanus corporis]EEB10086.1 hypothetical protein Phum_PHUM017940 [Pediculus humanus corporis]